MSWGGSATIPTHEMAQLLSDSSHNLTFDQQTALHMFVHIIDTTLNISVLKDDLLSSANALRYNSKISYHAFALSDPRLLLPTFTSANMDLYTNISVRFACFFINHVLCKLDPFITVIKYSSPAYLLGRIFPPSYAPHDGQDVVVFHLFTKPGERYVLIPCIV